MRARRNEAQQGWLDTAVAYKGDACIEWPFSKFYYGYGSVRINGRAYGAHRAVCERAVGPAPSEEHQAAHSCGNRLCCNPKHLRWATRSENMADKLIHDTHTRGERSPQTKLTREDVIAIRADARVLREIAADFGVSQQHVWLIKAGRKWGWL